MCAVVVRVGWVGLGVGYFYVGWAACLGGGVGSDVTSLKR